MSHSEINQIANVDREIINPATLEGQSTQEIMMAQLVNQLLITLGNTSGGSHGNNRLSVDIGTLYGTYPYQATIGTLTTLGTMNNQLLQGNVSSFLTAQYLSDQYTYAYLNNVTFS